MNKQAKPKIGQGALQAAARKGVKELQQVVVAFPGSVSAPTEAGELWSITTQGASQQTGVSQPVSFSAPSAPTGFEAMNGNTPELQPDIQTPELDSGGSILDSLVEQAQKLTTEPELEQEVEVEP